MKESSLQSAIIKIAFNLPILDEYLFHIPNGGYRNLREAKKLKLMGVKKGVSDLFLAYPNLIYHGMWQELKTEKGKLSEEQEEWIFRMRQVGFACEVVRSVNESINFFLSYLNNQYKPIMILKNHF